MKAFHFFRVVIILSGILLSACAGAPSSEKVSAGSNAGGGSSTSDVVFTGAIEAMNGDQWVINGQTITVDPSTLRDGPFTTGETVKVEARVADDGSVSALRVEAPAAAVLPVSVVNTPDVASTQAPFVSNSAVSEAVGTVESMTATTITINGQTYNLVQGTEIKGNVTAGTIVKVHFITNADGTLTVTEIGTASPAQVSGTASVDDNSSSSSVTDDHSSNSGNDDPPGDDHGNGGSSNDDSGGDDHGSGGSSSDDSSNHG